MEEGRTLEEKDKVIEQSEIAEGSVPTGDGELDPQVVLLALSVGGQILDYIASGDDAGLESFFNQITGEIRRQKRLVQLLQMEADDLDRVLSLLQNPSDSGSEEPSEKSADGVSESPNGSEPSPVQKLFTPAVSSGVGNQASGKRRLWDYVRGA